MVYSLNCRIIRRRAVISNLLALDTTNASSAHLVQDKSDMRSTNLLLSLLVAIRVKTTGRSTDHCIKQCRLLRRRLQNVLCGYVQTRKLETNFLVKCVNAHQLSWTWFKTYGHNVCYTGDTIHQTRQNKIIICDR